MIVIGLVVLLALAIKYWVYVAIGGAVALGVWLILRRSGSPTAQADVTRDATNPPELVRLTIQPSGRPAVAIASPSKPKASSGLTSVWIPPGKSATIAGLIIPGGMIYVGSTLLAPNGGQEPAQIDPRLPVDSNPISDADRLTGYWARYDGISPAARKAYLTWLAGGRNDPAANIGYIFLFYYGLERRVLVDAVSDPAAKAEIPLIRQEIRRLLAIYDNGSFQSYAGQFLDYLEFDPAAPRLYLSPPPQDARADGMSTGLRLALGQLAIDARPLPVQWALAWALRDTNIHLPTPAQRCPEQFADLFQKIYGDRFGEGMSLPVNRTKLKIGYRPASGGLISTTFSQDVGGLPDLTAVVAPTKKLQAIVNESSEALAAHSRFIGRNPDKAQSLEAILLLPPQLWPKQARAAFGGIDQRIGTGMIVIKLAEFVDALGGASTLTRERVKALVQALRTLHVGVEPDVLAGARTPKLEDSVVLFRLNPEESEQGSGANYEVAAVMLDLAMTVADADGEISPPEIQFLNRQIGAWSHLGAAAQRRLRARLRLAIQEPPTLASLRKRVEPLPSETKGALAKLLSTLALADGVISPGEVRLLEKIYKVLGIDSAQVYTDLHVAAAVPMGATPTPSAKPSALSAKDEIAPGTSFTLDPARIAALQGETERVTELLSKVFAEEAPPVPVSGPATIEPESGHTDEISAGLLGLDIEHSSFLRLLLSRASWSRQELNDAAADMELMLDGALERINEAALDKYDIPLAEGDDPIEIAQDLKEKIAA